MRHLLALAMALLATPALAFDRPLSPPTIPPLPPERGSEPVTRVLSYGPPPGAARCNGRNVGVVASAPFPPEVSVRYAPPGSPPEARSRDDRPTTVLAFAIDAQGSPIDIGRVDGIAASQDLIAAFARWRFMAGLPAEGCRIEVSQTLTPLSQATTATLLEIAAYRRRDTPLAVRNAISARGDCGRAPRRTPAVIEHPDLRAFNDRDFDTPWAGVLYDVDAEGQVRNVRIAAQGGDPALADLAAASIAGSRFHHGRPVSGCYGVFSARPEPAKAPARTPVRPFTRPASACKVDRASLNLSLDKSYPAPFARERVEGWALVAFDITPQGQVGPIEILASQPVDAFGLAARSMVYKARPAPSAWGQKGCLLPVSFAVPDIAED